MTNNKRKNRQIASRVLLNSLINFNSIILLFIKRKETYLLFRDLTKLQNVYIVNYLLLFSDERWMGQSDAFFPYFGNFRENSVV